MTILQNKILEDSVEKGNGLKSFVLANGVVTATYCKDSGKLITDACKADPRGSRAETGYFTAATVPTEKCDCHILVKFDKTTAGVAGKYCPAENIVRYSLIKVPERKFPYQIIVVDAQYVYRDLPDNIEPGAALNEPFFINTIPYGTYVGVSSYDTQFNHFCHSHYNIPVETLPEEIISEDETSETDIYEDESTGKKDNGNKDKDKNKKELPEDEIITDE